MNSELSNPIQLLERKPFGPGVLVITYRNDRIELAPSIHNFPGPYSDFGNQYENASNDNNKVNCAQMLYEVSHSPLLLSEK
jgi:hypothetical protein